MDACRTEVEAAIAAAAAAAVSDIDCHFMSCCNCQHEGVHALADVAVHTDACKTAAAVSDMKAYVCAAAAASMRGFMQLRMLLSSRMPAGRQAAAAVLQIGSFSAYCCCCQHGEVYVFAGLAVHMDACRMAVTAAAAAAAETSSSRGAVADDRGSAPAQHRGGISA
jgi:hypothetical protein